MKKNDNVVFFKKENNEISIEACYPIYKSARVTIPNRYKAEDIKSIYLEWEELKIYFEDGTELLIPSINLSRSETGVEYKHPNNICINDEETHHMFDPYTPEKRVYIIENFYIGGSEYLNDEEFISLAETHGKVWSLEQFQKDMNAGKINFSSEHNNLRII